LQEPLLFKGTLEENIRFFRPNISKKEIGTSPLHNFQLHSLVQPMGRNLSEGQRQLLSLKRASVGKRELLILDEATSSVDPVSELEIQKNLQLLLKGQTSLIIAHRLSTISSLDKILLLHDGRIAEEGSFDALMEKRGRFYNLWNLFKLEKQ
jgi:ATP-binding cassette subfamily B protein